MYEEEDDNAEWLRRGRQKRAIVQVLRRPMTNIEICRAAKARAPRIERWHVTRLLSAFSEKGIIYCINPHVGTGKLFWFSKYGKDLVNAEEAHFGVTVEDCPQNMDWDAYSFVVTSPMRKKVLLEMRTSPDLVPRTASAIRMIISRKQNTLGRKSFFLTQVSRTMGDLKKRKLIQRMGFTRKRHLQLYSISPEGAVIADELMRGYKTGSESG